MLKCAGQEWSKIPTKIRSMPVWLQKHKTTTD